MHTVNNHTY